MDAAVFPCIATVPDPDGGKARTVHTTYLQANDAGATVWAWSHAAQRPYPLVEGASAERPDGGDRYVVLDAEGLELADLLYSSSDCACQHPMKGWHPPGASRQSVT